MIGATARETSPTAHPFGPFDTGTSSNLIIFSSGNSVVLSKWQDPTEGMASDEKRAWRTWQNRLMFEDFIAEWLADRYEGRRTICTPYMQGKRKFGTSNGLRPIPMLC